MHRLPELTELLEPSESKQPESTQPELPSPPKMRRTRSSMFAPIEPETTRISSSPLFNTNVSIFNARHPFSKLSPEILSIMPKNMGLLFRQIEEYIQHDLVDQDKRARYLDILHSITTPEQLAEKSSLIKDLLTQVNNTLTMAISGSIQEKAEALEELEALNQLVNLISKLKNLNTVIAKTELHQAIYKTDYQSSMYANIEADLIEHVERVYDGCTMDSPILRR